MNTMKNKVQLIGNLGASPEILTLDGGRKRARLSLATHDFYKGKSGEKVEETTWHNVIAWGPVAELAEKLLAKGTEVMVEGKLTNREYTGKDGQQRRVTEVVIMNLMVLDKKKAA